MHASMSDAGANLGARFSVLNVSATAGAAGDNTEVDGAWVDRLGFGSMKVAIPFSVTLGDGETLSIAANMQTASDASGTGAQDYATALPATTVATGAAGGSTETGVVEMDVDLSSAGPFVRVQFTPSFSAGGADNADLAAVYIVTGATDNPVTSSLI